MFTLQYSSARAIRLRFFTLTFTTKADPEIQLRFLLRQFNRRLRMDQLKEIIKIAKEDSQQATLKLMEELNK
ncbi:MAG: hypothetical protein EZS28_027498 [Streblomastix strix]|uniref:Uncharacterized protein n=1 Tax=Streblomastix strix TaxID=222440 RepID=A0A5J4V213_9EUKA|nr:MAG: hypothetical protein EZS28_027498 [Streblomastix strix]